MRIVVVNTAASEGGALSILRDFYDYIKSINDNHEWIFILSGNYIEETNNIKVIIKEEVKYSWIKRLKWEFIYSAKFINNIKPDVVFSMQNTLSSSIRYPKMIYLHQPIPFQSTKKFSFIKKEERQLAIYQYFIGAIIKRSLKKSDKIVVQTNWMKESVLKSIKINKNSIIKVTPTIKNIDAGVEENYPNKNIFFYPASGITYKNHQCIVEAVRLLVREGIKNFEVKLTLDKSYIQILNITPDIQQNIKLVGNLLREEVLDKYRESVLIFPSYIETFGLPLLEARMVGSMIISSNCDFAKEILRDYRNVRYFNPFSPNELSQHMKSIIFNKIDYVYSNEKIVNEENTWKYIIKGLEEIK